MTDSLYNEPSHQDLHYLQNSFGLQGLKGYLRVSTYP